MQLPRSSMQLEGPAWHDLKNTRLFGHFGDLLWSEFGREPTRSVLVTVHQCLPRCVFTAEDGREGAEVEGFGVIILRRLGVDDVNRSL